jgi:hypothetical protein
LNNFIPRAGTLGREDLLPDARPEIAATVSVIRMNRRTSLFRGRDSDLVPCLVADGFMAVSCH